MSDVRDVLGIGGGAAAPAAPAAASASHARAHAHAHAHASSSSSGGGGGSSAPNRELALLKSEMAWGSGDTLAPAMLGGQLTKEQCMKAKRVKAVSWRLLPIQSSARASLVSDPTNDVRLLHWVKIHNVPDYRFAKFNKRVRMLEYTHDEYEAFLQDATWSRDETDRLMELAKKFDLRFIIMEDRYNEPRERAEMERVQAQLPKGPDAARRRELLHAKENQAAQAQAHAESAVVLSSNVTMSTHPTPAMALEAEAKEREVGSAQMDTSADETPAAAAAATATTTAATVTDSVAPAAAPGSAAAPGAAANAPAASDVAAAAPASGAATAPTVTLGGLSAAPLAPPAISPAVLPPAVPASSLSPPLRQSALPSSSSTLIFPHRSVEQLKSRFYFIQQTLASVRNASDPDLRKTNPLFTHPYDATHELLRKAQLERLYQRTASETDAMAELVLEHRNVSAQIKRIKKGQKEERDALRGYKTGGSSKSGRDRERERDRTGGSHKKSHAASRRVVLPQPLVGEMAPVPPSCDASHLLPSPPTGVFLRSAQLNGNLPLSARQSKFLESELAALNVRRARDALVPTSAVCDLWDRLRVNVITLANLQQYVTARETMRDDLRAHSNAHAAMPHATAAAAAAAASASAGLPASSSGLPPLSSPSSSPNPASQAQSASLALHRKKSEKRKMEGEGAEQDDKRARKIK